MLRTVKNKKETPETKKRTKSDWLTPTQFALKNGLTRQDTNDVAQEYYKKNILLNNITHAPMVIRNKLNHKSSPTPVLINPEAAEILIEKIKQRMAK